ncbi:MAG: phosphate acyltransferase PlsX [Acidimicrobiales bacterium]|nr:phosphate acyltransferase PlsX [Acidimicrobiia bacterium]NNC81529.1 phosphate acyltransferase PlsX [Acidimicrobiales bacterium]RZV47336.1 MAG: phosphate acyltransferase PlsX [Acidimicrobiales bacterium]
MPVAVDAMGGDNAPDAIVAGARRAVEERGIPVVLVGREAELGDTGGIPVIEASEVIAMDDDPGSSVRTMKDSSLVRAAEAVRDDVASAMVSAGNTGATMASALLRTGRIKGVSRPAIATPIPGPSGNPTVLLDAGANAECKAEWLVQFALMGSVFSQTRFNIDKPRIGLLSIGEEAGKGSPLVKETWGLLDAVDWDALGAEFVGNVEGRDLMGDEADVVVTDGFTGNVALKSVEGTAKNIIAALLEAFGSTPEAQAASEQLLPALLPLYQRFNADSYGGAMLLGTKGVCIISHGSSGEEAMVNAISVAAEMVESDLVGKIQTAVNA